MNIFRKTVLISLLTAGMLASCSSSQSAPTVSQADKMETAISTVSTGFAGTQIGMPTATAHGPAGSVPAALLTLTARPTATDIPTNTPLPRRTPTATRTFPPPSATSTSMFTDPSIPLSERIVYYYIVGQRENPIPEGAVHAVGLLAGAGVEHAVGLLAPTYADETFTSDTAADLRTALEIALLDRRNRESQFEPEIVDVTFRNGHAQVQLQAEYFIGTPSTSRDVCRPFVNGRMLILLTVFANPAVQTAAVTLNDDTIGNLCSIDAKPNNYVFTRAEIETYLKEHAHVAPTPTQTASPVPRPTEEATLSSTPAPETQTPGALTCQLNRDQNIHAFDGTNIWSEPDVVNGSLISTLSAGTSVYIISGPTWGRIQETGASGWWWEISNQSNGASAGWVWEGRIEECH